MVVKGDSLKGLHWPTQALSWQCVHYLFSQWNFPRGQKFFYLREKASLCNWMEFSVDCFLIVWNSTCSKRFCGLSRDKQFAAAIVAFWQLGIPNGSFTVQRFHGVSRFLFLTTMVFSSLCDLPYYETVHFLASCSSNWIFNSNGK